MLNGEIGVHISGCTYNLNCFQKQELENDPRSYSSLDLRRAWTNFCIVQEMGQGGLF